MSRHRKALERLCATPTPSDIRWQELRGVLEHLGYEMLKSSGSRRKFYNARKQALIICHEPHPSPCVDKACVADVVEHLKVHGFV
jgi:hypothetical protein